MKSITSSQYGQRALIRLLIEKLSSAGYQLTKVATSIRTYSARPSADLAFKLLNGGDVSSVTLWFAHVSKPSVSAHWVQLYDNEDPVNDWSAEDKRFSKICGKTNLQ